MGTHTTTVTIDGQDVELELDLHVAGAEHDVGIMSDYIDEWSVTSVDGDTSKERIDAMHEAIEAEYGEEAFLNKLYDEGAAEPDYDGYDYDPD